MPNDTPTLPRLPERIDGAATEQAIAEGVADMSPKERRQYYSDWKYQSHYDGLAVLAMLAERINALIDFAEALAAAPPVGGEGDDA